MQFLYQGKGQRLLYIPTIRAALDLNHYKMLVFTKMLHWIFLFPIFKDTTHHLQRYQLVWLLVFLALWGPIMFQSPPSHLLPCHMPIITVPFPLETEWIPLLTSLLLRSSMDQFPPYLLECMLLCMTAGASGAQLCTNEMILLEAILYLQWMWCTHLSIRHLYGKDTTH